MSTHRLALPGAVAVCGEQTRENGKNEGDWAFVWDPHGMRWLIARPAKGLGGPFGLWHVSTKGTR